MSYFKEKRYINIYYYSTEQNLHQDLLSNSGIFDSDLIKNLEEIFSRYWSHKQLNIWKLSQSFPVYKALDHVILRVLLSETTFIQSFIQSKSSLHIF